MKLPFNKQGNIKYILTTLLMAIFLILNKPHISEVSVMGRVKDVVDGDTLKVELGSQTETIRVIGIDTPETVHPTKPVECFGREASDKAKNILNGTTVTVVKDSSQGERDKYGRLLAYVILEDGKDFGEEMIRSGHAYEYTYDEAYKNQAIYKEAETAASNNGVGLWADGVCDN